MTKYHDRLFLLAFVAIFSLMCFLSCSPSDSAQSTVTLRGQGRMPANLVWEPVLLDFGTVDVGQVRDLVTTVRNAGGATANGTIALDSACEAAYTILDGGGLFVLQPGEALAVTVRFAPPTGEAYECAMRASY